MENTTLIDYRGIIRYDTIGELIHVFKQLVPKLGIPMSVYKRILLIMIESLENIMKHSENPPWNTNDQLQSAIRIKCENNRYFIDSSNIVSKDRIQFLSEKIDYLNRMDPQGLKRIYKETITDGVFTKTGGAGLGLIEIAKMSGNPIAYDFSPVDGDFVCYKQEVIVDGK